MFNGLKMTPIVDPAQDDFPTLDPPSSTSGIIPPPPPELRHSTRMFKPLTIMDFFSLSPPLDCILIPSYSLAIKEPYWQDAMAKELLVFETNQIWVLVPCLASVSIVEGVDLLHQSQI